jgi:hypothetical protein
MGCFGDKWNQMKVAVEITLATPALVNLSALTKEFKRSPETVVELVDAVIKYYTATDRPAELEALVGARRAYRGRA